jgi:hypothetical protein
MFVVDLVCADGHLFEGWYDSRAAFDEASGVGDVSCPICQGTDVDVRPSFRAVIGTRGEPAPRLSEREPSPSPAPALPLDVQRALSSFLKAVRAHAEDAGDQFAQRALAMHRGEEAPAPIHGTSTAKERDALREEGVPFLAVPIPDVDQN